MNGLASSLTSPVVNFISRVNLPCGPAINRKLHLKILTIVFSRNTVVNDLHSDVCWTTMLIDLIVFCCLLMIINIVLFMFLNFKRHHLILILMFLNLDSRPCLCRYSFKS